MTTPLTSKRMTEDDVVARLESGMTIGIGGWGSRRKPMSLVRAILRSDLDDLHVVSYGGPDVGMLCAAGKVSTLTFAFVSLDTIPLEPHFRKARQAGVLRCHETDEGMFWLGLQAAAWRVPFLPTRVGLGSDVLAHDPRLRTVTLPVPVARRCDARSSSPCPRSHLDAALVHLNRADENGNARVPRTRPVLRRPLARGRRCRVRVGRADRAGRLVDRRGRDLTRLRINRLFVDRGGGGAGRRPSHLCEPDYGRDEPFQAEYAATAKDDGAWEQFRQDWLSFGDEASYQAAVRGRP